MLNIKIPNVKMSFQIRLLKLKRFRLTILYKTRLLIFLNFQIENVSSDTDVEIIRIKIEELS